LVARRPSSQARFGHRLTARLGGREDGQTLIIVVLSIVVLLGFAGLAIDLGRVYVAQRQIQQAVDASALAASVDLSKSSVTALATAQSYSAAPGSQNVHTGMTAAPLVANPGAGGSGVTFLCLGHTSSNNSGAPCQVDANYCAGTIAPATQPGCNALRVKESADIDTPFLGLLGFGSFKAVSATATSSLQGGVPHPLDVVIVVDTTPSMLAYCNTTITGITNHSSNGTAANPIKPTKLDCAKEGIRALYQALLPCSPDLTTCGGVKPDGNVLHPDDEVSLIVMPALSAGTSDDPKERDCVDDGTNNPPNNNLPTSYPAPGTASIPNYQVVPFQSDYRSNDATTSLTSGSRLVQAVWWTNTSGGCAGSGGNAPTNDVYGIEATANNLASSFTGAIGTAQAALLQNYNANPGRHAQPVIIFLSDGEANTGSQTPCLDAYNQAQTAKTTTLPGNVGPTWFYSIAYDSSQNCTDSSGKYHNVAGLQLMKDMATNTTSFFFNQPAAGSLTAAFQAAGATLTGSRLVPDGSQ
jgi:Flp pilus assembly protein TadG